MRLFEVTLVGQPSGTERITYHVVTNLGELKAVAIACQDHSRDHPDRTIYSVEVLDLGALDHDDKGRLVTPGDEIYDWRELL